MPGDLKVSSYVTVRDRCPMRFRVNGRDEVEFSFGSRQDPFEFEFNAEALRGFLWLGSKARAERAARDEGRGSAPAI